MTPGEPVEIFLHPHDPSDEHSHGDGEDGGEEHHHHHGHITPWDQLYFPKGCGKTPGGAMPGRPRPPTTTQPRPDGSGQASGPGSVISPGGQPGTIF